MLREKTMLRDKLKELERLQARYAHQNNTKQRSSKSLHRSQSQAQASSNNARENRKGEPPRHWKAYRQMNEQHERRRANRHEAKVRSMHSGNDAMVDKTVVMLRMKITEHTRGDHDRIREACKVFGDSHGSKGINLIEFRVGMRHWNIPLSAEQAKMVFSRLDTNSTGYVDVYHMFRRLFPQSNDFPADVWYNHSESEGLKAAADEKAQKILDGHSKFVDERIMSDKQLLQGLRDRINERSRNSADRMRKAHRLFNDGNSSKGISYSTFNHSLSYTFGLRVNEKQSRRLFTFFDTQGKGHLHLQDLVQKLFPRKDDYPVKLWYIRNDEQQASHMQTKNRERQVWEERVPLPVRPKSAFRTQQELTLKLAASKSSSASQRKRPNSAAGYSGKWRPGDTNWQHSSAGAMTFSKRQLPWGS